MAFKYDEAVPWGRSFDEYRRMFHLTNEDLQKSILGCADGPASFNAGMFGQGHRVVSCDPLYQLTADQIRQRIEVTYEQVIGQTRQNQEKFVWEPISSPDELGRIRLEAMNYFLGDYERGKEAGRYIQAELPDLPFAPLTFDVALCSHFLFFYSDSFSLAFHRQAIDELCRVAHEVRIFPILTYNAEPCPFISPILDHIKNAGRDVSIEKVPYEFQRGGNMMMKVFASQIREPSKMTSIQSRPITADERKRAIAFLKCEGYAQAIGEGDRLFVSEVAGEIIGAVRLSQVEGVLVLRGMRVRSDVQRQGVGTHLLRRVVLAAQSESCYCIGYRWLIPFYSQVGFREATAEQVPVFLANRHAKYVNEGLDVVMMYRPPPDGFASSA